jgi:ethanolamine utilization protein EutQ (cupin superfamily)
MTAPANGLFVLHADAEQRKSYDYGQPVRVTVWEPLEPAAESLGAGTVTYDGQFDWDFKYEIAYYVLEGRLTLRSNGATETAEAGDIAVIRRGASVSFDAERCRAFWALYPGNWAEISDRKVTPIDGDPAD